MSQKLAYFNCLGGASGDMILGSMVDVGLKTEFLNSVITDLKLKDISIDAVKSNRQGVVGTKIHIEMNGQESHRYKIRDFLQKLENSNLNDHVVKKSQEILKCIGDAESQIHNADIDSLVLHELGSLDTLIDITCSVAGIHELDLDSVYSSALPSGSGIVHTEHGITPVPAPVTMAIISKFNVPLKPPPEGRIDTGEMVTPTGAVLLSSIAEFDQPYMKIDTLGYGLGSRNPESYPNVIGLWIGQSHSQSESLILIETNIDDSTPEVISYTVDRLISYGALDAWTTPINMKKNRNGVLLSVLCTPDLDERIRSIINKETTTFGIRSQVVKRFASKRETILVSTEIGNIPVKLKYSDNELTTLSPEYEVCRKIAMERQIPLKDVMQIALYYAKKRINY
tara:strand:- start:262 stop:1452 length:1191 start_codon:yes stop_codon:yes gene_type:complete